MSTTYRPSRNIESSFVDYLTDNFNADWTGVSVEKGFAKVYDLECPIVAVRCGITAHNKAQIGDSATIRVAQVLIDIFARSDGQRLDLKDYIVSKIKGGLVYYEYTTTIVGREAVVESGDKVANGRIRVATIDDVPVDFNVDKSKLDVRDRFRHLLTLEISLGRVEQ